MSFIWNALFDFHSSSMEQQPRLQLQQQLQQQEYARELLDTYVVQLQRDLSSPTSSLDAQLATVPPEVIVHILLKSVDTSMSTATGTSTQSYTVQLMLLKKYARMSRGARWSEDDCFRFYRIVQKNVRVFEDVLVEFLCDDKRSNAWTSILGVIVHEIGYAYANSRLLYLFCAAQMKSNIRGAKVHVNMVQIRQILDSIVNVFVRLASRAKHSTIYLLKCASICIEILHGQQQQADCFLGSSQAVAGKCFTLLCAMKGKEQTTMCDDEDEDDDDLRIRVISNVFGLWASILRSNMWHCRVVALVREYLCIEASDYAEACRRHKALVFLHAAMRIMCTMYGTNVSSVESICTDVITTVTGVMSTCLPMEILSLESIGLAFTLTNTKSPCLCEAIAIVQTLAQSSSFAVILRRYIEHGMQEECNLGVASSDGFLLLVYAAFAQMSTESLGVTLFRWNDAVPYLIIFAAKVARSTQLFSGYMVGELRRHLHPRDLVHVLGTSFTRASYVLCRKLLLHYVYILRYGTRYMPAGGGHDYLQELAAVVNHIVYSASQRLLRECTTRDTTSIVHLLDVLTRVTRLCGLLLPLSPTLTKQQQQHFSWLTSVCLFACQRIECRQCPSQEQTACFVFVRAVSRVYPAVVDRLRHSSSFHSADMKICTLLMSSIESPEVLQFLQQVQTRATLDTSVTQFLCGVVKMAARRTSPHAPAVFALVTQLARQYVFVSRAAHHALRLWRVLMTECGIIVYLPALREVLCDAIRAAQQPNTSVSYMRLVANLFVTVVSNMHASVNVTDLIVEYGVDAMFVFTRVLLSSVRRAFHHSVVRKSTLSAAMCMMHIVLRLVQFMNDACSSSSSSSSSEQYMMLLKNNQLNVYCALLNMLEIALYDVDDTAKPTTFSALAVPAATATAVAHVSENPPTRYAGGGFGGDDDDDDDDDDGDNDDDSVADVSNVSMQALDNVRAAFTYVTQVLQTLYASDMQNICERVLFVQTRLVTV